jgi:transposase
VGAAIVTPWVNSEAMTVHLAEIGKQVRIDAHAVLVCDGAGWHQTGQRLTVPRNVTLLRLPPYSPELNPIENVWEYLRANQLSRRVWRCHDDIVEACCDAWNWLIADQARVSSITTRKWASVRS